MTLNLVVFKDISIFKFPSKVIGQIFMRLPVRQERRTYLTGESPVLEREISSTI